MTEERRLIIDFAEMMESDRPGHSHGVIPELRGARLVSYDGKQAVYTFDPDKVKASELIKEAASSFEVEDILTHNASIEEIIARLYHALGI